MDEIWLDLHQYPLEKTKLFARSLFEMDIEHKHIRFDKKGDISPVKRRGEPNMALDYYLDNLTEHVQIRYVLGREEYFNYERIPGIILILRDNLDDQFISHFAWFNIPYNEQNYNKIDQTFKIIYGTSMEDCKRLP
jgi:hypothetical protein